VSYVGFNYFIAQWPPAVNLDQLRLNDLTALIHQAGWSVPARQEVDDVAYLQGLIDAICELSTRDPLTGVANRRAFLSVLNQEIDRVARSGEPALLVAVDIDHFKQVNDRYGHLVGDQVIRAVAAALKECVRPMDTVARLGGEEFAVVFPNCPPSFGEVVAERLRAAVLRLELEAAGQRLPVTVSCGGAYAPPWVRTTADAWMERADREMYRAKASGRNCVCLEHTPISEVSAEEKGLLFAWSSTDPLMMQPAASS